MPENNSALKLTKSKMPQVGITAGWFEDWGATYKLYGGSAESGVGLVCTYPPLHIDIDIDVDKFDLQ